jgi:hypothetical protein
VSRVHFADEVAFVQVHRQFFEVSDRLLVIGLPESFVNHRVELIVLTADDEIAPNPRPPRTHPEIAGKGQTLAPVAWEGFAEGFTGFSQDFGISDGLARSRGRRE